MYNVYKLCLSYEYVDENKTYMYMYNVLVYIFCVCLNMKSPFAAFYFQFDFWYVDDINLGKSINYIVVKEIVSLKTFWLVKLPHFYSNL